MSSATLTVEPLLQTKITGRALRLIGISFPAVALAQIICIYGFSAMGRTLTGLLVAALRLGGGHILAQRSNSQSWWSVTMLMGGFEKQDSTCRPCSDLCGNTRTAIFFERKEDN